MCAVHNAVICTKHKHEFKITIRVRLFLSLISLLTHTTAHAGRCSRDLFKILLNIIVSFFVSTEAPLAIRVPYIPSLKPVRFYTPPHPAHNATPRANRAVLSRIHTHTDKHSLTVVPLLLWLPPYFILFFITGGYFISLFHAILFGRFISSPQLFN